jgi:hypothetical protein
VPADAAPASPATAAAGAGRSDTPTDGSGQPDDADGYRPAHLAGGRSRRT